MRVPRILGLAFALMLSILFLHMQIERYQLNVLKRRLELDTTVSVSIDNPNARVRIARNNLEVVEPHLGRFPPDADVYMIAAANYRLIADYGEAEQMYRRALRIARRPETYLNLGDTLLAQGKTEEALESYAVAVGFSTTYYERVPLLRERVLEMSRAQPAAP